MNLIQKIINSLLNNDFEFLRNSLFNLIELSEVIYYDNIDFSSCQLIYNCDKDMYRVSLSISKEYPSKEYLLGLSFDKLDVIEFCINTSFCIDFIFLKQLKDSITKKQRRSRRLEV